jgi:ATP phosphoribosyltransferase regulatory subunit HisZ
MKEFREHSTDAAASAQMGIEAAGTGLHEAEIFVTRSLHALLVNGGLARANLSHCKCECDRVKRSLTGNSISF